MRKSNGTYRSPSIRGGVEDTRLEAKAKHTKKFRGQDQLFRRQTLSRPRTEMLEAKAKNQRHRRQVFSKRKKKRSSNFFSGELQKKGLQLHFSVELQKIRSSKNLLSGLQNFNVSKNSAILEARTGQFSRT